MKRKIIVEIKEDRNHYALIKQDNKRENEYDYGMLIDKDQFEQLRLYGVSKRFSPKESTNVLRKPKLALISTDLKNILERGNGDDYNKKEDIEFINKYAGRRVLVYEWANDWWICEDDNYPLFKKCFEFVD